MVITFKGVRSSIRTISVLTAYSAFVVGSALTVAAEPEVKPRVKLKPPERVVVPVDRDRFGEGWTQKVPLNATSGDRYELSVKDGWLQVSRRSGQGTLDWQVMLARASDSEPPTISLVSKMPSFELSYRAGRYFIRDTAYALRCVRERADAEHCVPRAAILKEGAKHRGTRGGFNLMLSDWEQDGWFFVTSGPDDEHFNAVVRLNPVERLSPGSGSQTLAGSFVRYFNGDTWVMDDGELLVSVRMSEEDYKQELATEKIQKNFPGSVPPDIDATTWLNSDGASSWTKLKGKVVLLDFWGTWCGPCVKKLPHVQKFHDKYRDRGLVVIGVHSTQDGETCKDFIEQNGITFPIAVDSGKTAESFAITEWPSIFLIDKSGKVSSGYDSDLPTDEMVEQLLKQ